MRSPGAWAMCWVVSRAVDRAVGTAIQTRRAAEPPSSAVRLGECPEGITVTRHEIAVAGGHIDVYRYQPTATSGPIPAHVFLHSGAFWAGTAATLDARCREFVTALNCAVLSVEYRRAPEHPYPVPVEDSYAAVCWATAQAASLGIDPARISVGGVSSGGALAAAVALLARDRDGPALISQVLETPVLDLTMGTRSARRTGGNRVLTHRALVEGYDFYAPDPLDRRAGYASPLLAGDLSGLPPAIVLVAEHDPLRDEGEQYVARLQAAGVAAQLVFARGHAHATVHLGGRFFRSAALYRSTVTEALRAAYASAPVS